jgi:hypothetical protein
MVIRRQEERGARRSLWQTTLGVALPVETPAIASSQRPVLKSSRKVSAQRSGPRFRKGLKIVNPVSPVIGPELNLKRTGPASTTYKTMATMTPRI